MKMKVYKEWLVDENNKIIHMTLEDWSKHLGLRIMEGTNRLWITDNGRIVTIERKGGYGLRHDEFKSFAHKIFFADNADLEVLNLREKYW